MKTGISGGDQSNAVNFRLLDSVFVTNGITSNVFPASYWSHQLYCIQLGKAVGRIQESTDGFSWYDLCNFQANAAQLEFFPRSRPLLRWVGHGVGGGDVVTVILGENK